MENYIVRIYRFQKDNPRQLVGIVESVEDEKREKRAFTQLDDLWQILNSHGAEDGLQRHGEVTGGSRMSNGWKGKISDGTDHERHR